MEHVVTTGAGRKNDGKGLKRPTEQDAVKKANTGGKHQEPTKQNRVKANEARVLRRTCESGEEQTAEAGFTVREGGTTGHGSQ